MDMSSSLKKNICFTDETCFFYSYLQLKQLTENIAKQKMDFACAKLFLHFFHV